MPGELHHLAALFFEVIMNEWNEHGVCLDPTSQTVQVKKLYNFIATIKMGEYEGRFSYGYDIRCALGGCSGGPFCAGAVYNTEREAWCAGWTFAKGRVAGELDLSDTESHRPNIKALIELIDTRLVYYQTGQQELF